MMILTLISDRLPLELNSSRSKDAQHSEGSDSKEAPGTEPRNHDHADPVNNKRMGIFHYNEGNKAFRLNQWDRAAGNYMMALEHDDQFAEAWVNLSTTYLRSKEYEKAFKTLQDFREKYPNHPLLHYNLACYYSLTQKTESGLNSLKLALSLGYDNPESIHIDPDLENIRNTQEFKTWMKRWENGKSRQPQKT